ncbi:MAG: hypothetical protein K8R79_05820, partial [Calditrichales bacterium]|nr:hypothetical protein [Calditrichales bacterium]
MKAKIIYMLILFLICSSMLYFQTDNQIEKKVTDYQTKLNLSEKQCEQFRVILLKQKQEAQKERAQNKDNPNALFTAAKERKELMDKQIKNILTEEQWAKYKNMEKQDFSDRQLLELKERLLLTDEQVEQIQPIMAKTREKLFTLSTKNYDQ